MGKAAKFLYLLSGRIGGLLGEYGGAAAAYSLRSLTASSTTNVVKVRRSGDDAELDFSASQVSDGTLAAWVVAGGGTEDGFVTTWYDQSGNANNATQATAANQPKIVSSGTLVTENGKAALDFDGTDDLMGSTITGMQNFTNLSIFGVIIPDNASAPDTTSQIVFGYADGGPDSSNRGLSFGATTGALSNETFAMYFSNSTLQGRLGSSTYSHSAGDQLLHSQFYLSSGTSLYKNSSQITLNRDVGITVTTDTSPSNAEIASDTFYISSINGIIVSPSQKVQELVVYPSDQSANRTGIEDNINAHYNIYP